ncbi:MAG: hypothetical protein ABIP35_10515 [Ginsengibacter sp.]
MDRLGLASGWYAARQTEAGSFITTVHETTQRTWFLKNISDGKNQSHRLDTFCNNGFQSVDKKHHFSLKRAIGSNHIINYKNQNRKMVRAYGSLSIFRLTPTD